MKPFLGPEEPATSHALRRVLVIDADPAARRMIGQALAAVATCTEAGDMDRAFAVLDRGDPDLIVLCLDDGASTEPDTIETIRFALEALRAQGERLAEQARSDALELGILVARRILEREGAVADDAGSIACGVA